MSLRVTVIIKEGVAQAEVTDALNEFFRANPDITDWLYTAEEGNRLAPATPESRLLAAVEQAEAVLYWADLIKNVAPIEEELAIQLAEGILEAQARHRAWPRWEKTDG
jgi:hypothetical protein